MADQLDLPRCSAADLPPKTIVAERGPELLELLAVTATEWNRGEVAHEIDLSLSGLNNALLDRDRHSLKWKHLFYFLLRSPRVLAWVADLAGYRIERVKPPSPEEELAALKAALLIHGDFGKHVIDEARAALRTTRTVPK